MVAPVALRKSCERWLSLEKPVRWTISPMVRLPGVAYYWSLLQDGMSVAQNFDWLFFGEREEMRLEFNRVFASLFKMPTMHMAVVHALGGMKSGMTRRWSNTRIRHMETVRP